MTLKLERADIMAEREDKLKELEKITMNCDQTGSAGLYCETHSRQNTEETDNASELMKERKKKWLNVHCD